MQTEFEIKILEIDVENMKNKLEKLWAKYIWEKNQKRYVYNFDPASYNRWIRLRTDWKTSTLCIKDIQDESKIDGTKELEIVVDNFEKTNQILEQLWYKSKAYQENTRISYKLDDCDVELDLRPLIPPYLEIEGPDKESVEKVLEKLNVENKTTTSENTTAVYKRYWIEDLEKIKELKFEK